MPIEHTRQFGRLGLAQDGELASRIDHGAAVLAQLHGDVAEGLHLGGVSRGCQHLRQFLGRASVGSGDLRREVACPVRGEPGHRLRPELRSEVPQG